MGHFDCRFTVTILGQLVNLLVRFDNRIAKSTKMLNTGKLAGRTLFITGASRGIGKAIALKAAKDGANIVIAAKTAEAHPKLPGTIYPAAKEIEAAGGHCLPCIVDVRDENQIQKAVNEAVKKFGGIDILVNNASAISLTNTLDTPMKKYDLMHHVNTRGTYLVSKLCLPYLKIGKNPHILNLSPPLNMNPVWFQNHVAYTMDMLGKLMGGEDTVNSLRFPAIMADAAYVILTRDSKSFTRNFCIDEDVLKEVGVTDFDQYAVKPGTPLMPDFFLTSSSLKPKPVLHRRLKLPHLRAKSIRFSKASWPFRVLKYSRRRKQCLRLMSPEP